MSQKRFFWRRLRQGDARDSDMPSESDAESKIGGRALSFTKALSWSPSSRVGTENRKGALGLTLLHSPPTPQVDFVFVHGLGGGSKKTWSKTLSPDHYWPKEWLPQDPEFQNVRINTFGYDSDYSSGKDDCFNVHHFGKSLLAEISTSPHILHSNTKIVAIGHSMGGLVIKKAWILAKQNDALNALADRFAAFYFLATPHRGADSAKILKNIVRFAYGRDRGYITDLGRNSDALQVINDEFRHVPADIEIWSFYETETMKMFNSLIVDFDSATLGSREETQVPMAADHRSICKFDTPSDANYKILRQCLASTVEKLSARAMDTEMAGREEQLRGLRRYLGAYEVFRDDLRSAQDLRSAGSCKWLLQKDEFSGWKNSEDSPSKVLWVEGKPGTGKSILAGFVIDTLLDAGLACSYFFFKAGNRLQCRASACFRALAFQMATRDDEVRCRLAEMKSDRVQIDYDDPGSLWRSLFASEIFRTKMSQHYWVIDGLDECVDHAFFLETVLPQLDSLTPLRILITSRGTPYLKEKFAQLQGKLQSISITVSDTLSDMRLLVEPSAMTLAVVRSEEKASFIQMMLDKSNGSFLWTSLVLKQLGNTHLKSDVTQVLKDVPLGMELLYQRTLDSLSQLGREKELIKEILTWVTCALRPITVQELVGALKLGIEEEILNIEQIISVRCGQLLMIDKSSTVRMVHGTAREYLLNPDLESEFAVHVGKAHTHLAKSCLIYLTGLELSPPRTRRWQSISTSNAITQRAAISSYAIEAYSYHLSKADPNSMDVFQLLAGFLKSNVLSWICAVAESRNLNQLIRTSKHLRSYTNACNAQRSPLDPRVRSFREWTTDLVRLTAKFSNALIASPSSIYGLIPAFCPTQSMIHNTGYFGRGFEVLGDVGQEWDDRLSCIVFHQGRTSAICYGDDFLAIGLTNGTILLYHTASYQQYRDLSHGEYVTVLRTQARMGILVSCGLKTIKVWNIRGDELMHTIQISHRPLGVSFDKDLLIVATERNYIASWDLAGDATRKPDIIWNDSNAQAEAPLTRPPSALALSTSHQLLAVAYPWHSILLWDLRENGYFGTCGKKLSNGETSTHVVVEMLFNPNPAIPLLVVSYLDGDLALLDVFRDTQLACVRASCRALSGSPDGRFLTAGVANGTIHIYEFDTLRLIYRVRSSNAHIKQIALSRDGLHLADIRATQCNIWEPPTLMRETLGDDSSGTTTMSVLEHVSPDAKSRLTTMAVHPLDGVVFCGKDDGAVAIYSLKSATMLRGLYNHPSPIRQMAWSRLHNLLFTVDGAQIFAYRLRNLDQAENEKSQDEVVFKERLDTNYTIIDVCLGEPAKKFIVSTRQSDYLWSFDGKLLESRVVKPDAGVCKWTQHPASSNHAIRIDCTEVRIYCWSDWSEVACFQILTNNPTISEPKRLFHLTLGRQYMGSLLEISERHGSSNTQQLLILDLSDAPSGINDPQKTLTHMEEGSTEPTVQLTVSAKLGSAMVKLADRVVHILGVADSGLLVFFDKHSWVCSVSIAQSLEKSNPEPLLQYARHFFIPYDWFAGARDIVGTVVQKDIVLARNDGMVIIRKWEEPVEMVTL